MSDTITSTYAFRLLSASETVRQIREALNSGADREELIAELRDEGGYEFACEVLRVAEGSAD